MRKSWVLVVSLLALAGCTSVPEAPAQSADASDSACSATADGRARDAAINGYDKETQKAIRQESYKSCVAWSKKSVLVESTRR